jgi:hypothetical protein
MREYFVDEFHSPTAEWHQVKVPLFKNYITCTPIHLIQYLVTIFLLKVFKIKCLKRFVSFIIDKNIWGGREHYKEKVWEPLL